MQKLAAAHDSDCSRCAPGMGTAGPHTGPNAEPFPAFAWFPPETAMQNAVPGHDTKLRPPRAGAEASRDVEAAHVPAINV